MRGALLLIAACGGTATPAPTPPKGSDAKPVDRPLAEDKDHAPIDPIAVLAPDDDQPVSWLSPGSIQLELGGQSIQSPGGNRPIEVAVIDHHANVVRAAVRLDHARFSLWSDRTRLFGVLSRDTRVETFAGQNPMDDMQVTLKAGARIKRLAKKNGRAQVRYVGALEVEGWISDEVIGESGAKGGYRGRIPSGRRSVMMIPGTIIRSQPQWGNNELALVAQGYMLDSIREQQDGWIEVGYADGDVNVHGWTSKMQPPGRIHRPRDPDAPPPVITPNAKVASGTCLYSKRDGDAVGYIVEDRDVQLDDAGSGWWTLSIDTPWGPIPFAAKGPAAETLRTCAPSGTVPASKLSPPP